MKPVVVYLDTQKKVKGKTQYRLTNRITCPEYNLEIVGDGAIVKAMAYLLAQNKCPINRIYKVLRGDTTVFELKPLKSWVISRPQPEQLRKK